MFAYQIDISRSDTTHHYNYLNILFQCASKLGLSSYQVLSLVQAFLSLISTVEKCRARVFIKLQNLQFRKKLKIKFLKKVRWTFFVHPGLKKRLKMQLEVNGKNVERLSLRLIKFHSRASIHQHLIDWLIQFIRKPNDIYLVVNTPNMKSIRVDSNIRFNYSNLRTKINVSRKSNFSMKGPTNVVPDSHPPRCVPQCRFFKPTRSMAELNQRQRKLSNLVLQRPI